MILIIMLMLVYNLNNRTRTGERLPQLEIQTLGQSVPHADLHKASQSIQQHHPSHLYSARRSLSKEPSYSVHRYMLSLSYWEQLTMGVRNLFSLACFGDLWNMSVVQPFTYNSRLYGLPNFKPGEYIFLLCYYACNSQRYAYCN